MSFKTVLVYHSRHDREVPDMVRDFADHMRLRLADVRTTGELVEIVNRSIPACIIINEDALDVCGLLKSDPFSAIIPVVCLMESDDPRSVLMGLESGADEVVSPSMDERERMLRLGMALKRADRDVSVHPTTRLPGTVQIERDIAERVRGGHLFAVCYADIDHFKEFNDRYGYTEGDQVILIVSRILRDIVKAHSPDGFIGHIGGDDFIFNVPLDKMSICCEQVIEVFDELLPFQYTSDDRERKYFLGKDRRGNVFRIPIMTLSIGVVTNEHRIFSHTARVSELASEMKAYAKTLPGSIFAVDRRRDFAEGVEESFAPAAPRTVAGGGGRR